MSIRILVTGANGFVGQALCQALNKYGYFVRAAVRSNEKLAQLPEGVEYCIVGEVGLDTEWGMALEGIDTVIHLTSRVHLMQDNSSDPLSEYRKINTAGTERLARIAAQSGVSRFIFLSSVKVNGEYTRDDKVASFSEVDTPNPQDGYAVSKWEAEQALTRIGKETGLETVILRPPLIYGPCVKANFLSLLKIIDSGVPLPFAAIKSKRSFIYLGNLIDIILQCIINQKASGQTFLVSDGEDIIIPQLMRKIAKSMGRSLILMPIPVGILKFFGEIIGRKSEVDRLVKSLVIDNRKIIEVLNWKAPYSLDEGIGLTVKSYLGSK